MWRILSVGSWWWNRLGFGSKFASQVPETDRVQFHGNVVWWVGH